MQAVPQGWKQEVRAGPTGAAPLDCCDYLYVTDMEST